MTKLRILSGADIRRATTMSDIIDAMETAFTALSSGTAKMPIRAHIEIDEPEGTALFMPSYMKATEMIGIKTVTLFEDNRANGLPYIQGMVGLLDGKNGAPLAILDGMTVTALRTGAASGLATKLLARDDASVCAVFGAGVQGRTQLEAVCAVRKIEKAFVFDRFPESAQRYATEMGEMLNIDVSVASTPKDAVCNADVICCATFSETPVFDADDLPDGCHVNAVGSYKPHVQEVPEEMVLRSRLFVDHRESALEETGDLIIPIQKGLMTEAHILGELGELVTGQVIGRTSDVDITFFKSVGLAVQDLAAAAAILHKAEAQNIGVLAEL